MANPVTSQFAQLVCNMAIENVPVAATDQIRWRVLRTLAIMLNSGFNLKRQVAAPYVAGTHVSNGSSLDTGTSASSGAEPAANATGSFQNQPVLSALLHGARLDLELYDAGVQPGPMMVDAAIVPAAWAQVQDCQGSGHLFMSALAAGYVATGILAGLPDNIDHGQAWQAAAVNGAVGAAATAARARSLPASATLDAMGFAVAQATQMAQNTATAVQVCVTGVAGDVLQLQPDLPGPGRAAMDGVLSAQMAALGGRCPPALIDQLQLAMSTESLNQGLSDAWFGAAQCGRLCSEADVMQGFRKRVASVISGDEAEAIIEMVLRLEHTAPGELTTYVNERIGARLDV